MLSATSIQTITHILLVVGLVFIAYMWYRSVKKSQATMRWTGSGWQGGFTYVKEGSGPSYSMYDNTTKSTTPIVSQQHTSGDGWYGGAVPTPGDLMFNGRTAPNVKIPEYFSTITYGGNADDGTMMIRFA